jgi:hypothetical protein
MYSVTENMCSPFSIQSVAFWYTDFYTTLYFVSQRNYKTLAMQADALTRTRYFYSLKVIISHPIVYTERLGYLSVCATTLRPSPPTHVCICNGHPSSQLFYVHRALCPVVQLRNDIWWWWRRWQRRQIFYKVCDPECCITLHVHWAYSTVWRVGYLYTVLSMPVSTVSTWMSYSEVRSSCLCHWSRQRSGS